MLVAKQTAAAKLTAFLHHELSLAQLAVEKGVKMTLAAMLPATVRYRLLHHASKSNLDLQIADYCTWAIYRKWNAQDGRSLRRVQAAVRREWDVLQAGTGFPD